MFCILLVEKWSVVYQETTLVQSLREEFNILQDSLPSLPRVK